MYRSSQPPPDRTERVGLLEDLKEVEGDGEGLTGLEEKRSEGLGEELAGLEEARSEGLGEELAGLEEGMEGFREARVAG